MKWVLIAAIFAYRGLVPPSKRRKCLYNESCSRFVERIARDEGFSAAIKAIKQRVRSCRGGYRLIAPDQGALPIVRLVDGSLLSISEVSESLRQSVDIFGDHRRLPPAKN